MALITQGAVKPPVKIEERPQFLHWSEYRRLGYRFLSVAEILAYLDYRNIRYGLVAGEFRILGNGFWEPDHRDGLTPGIMASVDYHHKALTALLTEEEYGNLFAVQSGR